jgi:phosphatidate cytidylyltransferase
VIRQRVLSAAVIVILLLAAVLWLPAWWSAVTLTVIMVLAAWEWSGFVAAAAPLQRASFLAATGALCVLFGWWSNDAAGMRQILWVALAFWSTAAGWIFLWPQRVNRGLVAAAGLLALSLAWVALVRLRTGWADGRYVVLYALLIVWTADSGAYFAGRQWGARKLAPLVSPGKTLAGLWGGLAASALLAVIVARYCGDSVLRMVALTIVVALYSVVGDLTESLCKRFAGLKDSGSLIPGHGGVLDRFDSLLAAAPLLMLGIELLHISHP